MPSATLVIEAATAAKSYGPGLAELIQIVGGGGGAMGSFVGLLIPTQREESPRRLWHNASSGLAIGGVVGTWAAFALWAAIRLNGGVE